MKYFNFLSDLFFIKKIKSEGTYDIITNWELINIFKSIKKNNRINCPNCEEHYLIVFENSDKFNKILYCEFCGQTYIFKNIINNFSKLLIINNGKNDQFINFDVIRYKKIKKVINKNVYTNSTHKN